jgi:hypothetical protein
MQLSIEGLEDSTKGVPEEDLTKGWQGDRRVERQREKEQEKKRTLCVNKHSRIGCKPSN